MLTDVWTGLGSKLSERWAAAVFSPAVLFWATGLVAWLSAHGPPGSWNGIVAGWLARLGAAAVPVQLAWIAGALGALVISQLAVGQVTLPVLRLLEGYWPSWLDPVRRPLVDRVSRHRDREASRWRTLQIADAGARTAAEQAELVRLERRLARVPVLDIQRMPTRLGNALRASESRPDQKYGLDAVTCWPRLWLLLPESVRAEVSAARSRLDQAAQMWTWGALALVWTPWAWWAPALALLVMAAAYLAALSAARTYGDLIEASYDLYRTDLYRAVRVALPGNAADEYACGQALTRYLRRGSRSPKFRLTE